MLADPDSRHTSPSAKWILAGAVIDSHSHTFIGQAWIAKEWLSRILLALAESASGWSGVATLCVASIGATLALLLRLLMRDLRPLPRCCSPLPRSS